MNEVLKKVRRILYMKILLQNKSSWIKHYQSFDSIGYQRVARDGSNKVVQKKIIVTRNRLSLKKRQIK